MPETFISVPWFEQEKSWYCGPAVAQMTLSALGLVAPNGPLSWQDHLWEDIKAETKSQRPRRAGSGSASNPAFATQKCEKCAGKWNCWSTTPDALESTLNLHLAGVQYATGEFTTENDASAVLMQSITNTVPGLALVYGWAHWVVVDGFVHDEANPCTTIGGVGLNGIYIRNPQKLPGEVHLVECDAWRDDYLSFVPCGAWGNTMVVLGGTPTPPLTPLPPAVVAPRGPRPPEDPRRDWSLSMPNQRIVPPDAAIREAERSLERLLTLPRWGVSLVGASSGSPVLVQRLDRQDDYYYIVPFGRSGQVTARLIIAALEPRLRESQGIEGRTDRLQVFVDPARFVAGLRGEVELSDGTRHLVRPGTVSIHPLLVWRPCRESTSPFLPFFVLTVNGSVVYLRADGQLFPRLTTGPA